MSRLSNLKFLEGPFLLCLDLLLLLLVFSSCINKNQYPTLGFELLVLDKYGQSSRFLNSQIETCTKKPA